MATSNIHKAFATRAPSEIQEGARQKAGSTESVGPVTPQTGSAPWTKETHLRLIDFYDKRTSNLTYMYNMRFRMEQIDKQYQRELDYTEAQRRAKAANTSGDALKIQNVVIPIVQPQVEAALTKLSEIFLSSYPIFPVIAKPGAQPIALQLETALAEQAMEFGWSVELLKSMGDCLRYNLAAVECDWESIKTSRMINDPTASIEQGTASPTTQEGNRIKRLNLYNTFADTRVEPYEVHTKGEFAGYHEQISLIELQARLENLDRAHTANFKEALESGNGEATNNSSTSRYYVPRVNPNALLTPDDTTGTNWDRWVGLEAHDRQIKLGSRYDWSVMYFKMQPRLAGIHNKGQDNRGIAIYKMIVINHKYIVFLKRLTNAHNMLPIIFYQCKEDGLGWQDKSFADNSTPYQQIASALYNSGIESQRRKVYDRILYDPTRVAAKDIERVSAVARIPVKPEAYGKPLAEAVYAFPYRDENVPQIFASARDIIDMADVAAGQNRMARGQFQKGNKTRYEVEQVENNSEARPQLMALIFEFRLFQPLKTILKLNTFQFAKAGPKLNRVKNQIIEIDPVQLRQQVLEFKLADGLFPTNSVVNLSLMEKVINMVSTNPAMAQGYDVMGIVMYWLQLQGASWIENFKLNQQVPQGQPDPNAGNIPPA